jgi:hypothetical protein
MKRLGSLLTLALALSVWAQEPANQSDAGTEPTIFTKAQRIGEDKWRSFFVFSLAGHEYTIRRDGHSEISTGKARPQNFDLKANRGHIEQLYFIEHEGDLVLLYELSDDQNGWGYITRLNQSTRKFKWVAGISGSNLGPALVETNYVYLTGGSLIAKLDLQSGAYVWKQEGLREKYSSSFQVFQAPWIKGDHVFFREDLEPFKTMEVDKLSGKIIDIRE